MQTSARTHRHPSPCCAPDGPCCAQGTPVHAAHPPQCTWDMHAFGVHLWPWLMACAPSGLAHGLHTWRALPWTCTRSSALPQGAWGPAQSAPTCKAQRDVIHGVDHHACVRGRVLGDAAQALLEHVVAIQELHLIRGLDPDLHMQWVRRQHERAAVWEPHGSLQIFGSFQSLVTVGRGTGGAACCTRCSMRDSCAHSKGLKPCCRPWLHLCDAPAKVCHRPCRSRGQ